MDTLGMYPNLRLKEALIPLFQQDLSLSGDLIQGIMALPREDLLHDLCLILAELPVDLPANEQDLKEGDFPTQDPSADVLDPQRSFVVHTLNLLAALRAVGQWPVIKAFLAQEQTQLKFWLGPYIELGLWEVLFDLMRDRFQELGALLQEGQLANELRIPVLNALVQVAWHLPIHRRAVLAHLTEVMEALLAGNLPADPAFAGELVREIRDLRAERLLPVIRRLYAEGMVQTAVAGTLEAVEAGLTGPVRSQAKRPHLNIYQRYDVYRSQHRLSAPEDQGTAVKMEKAQPARPGRGQLRTHARKKQPLQKGQKVGRNQPCPCGSGRKYKHCHGK